MAKRSAENSGKTAKRSAGRPFAKGTSGNPGGRPKLPTEIRERAQHYAVEMLDTLRNLAVDPDEKGPVRVAAAIAVLDRAHGKPVAPIVTASTKEPTLLELIEASMARREEREAATLTIEHSSEEA